MSLQTQISSLVTRLGTEFKTVKNIVSGNNSGSLIGLNTTVKTSIMAAINELVTSISGKQPNLGYTAEDAANKGAANGYAALDGAGKVPATQLPSYVDDILEFDNLATFPMIGESGKLYVALDSNLTYRWSGSGYVLVSQSLALGETSNSAFRGDRGKAAYDHSQIYNGMNPHGTTFANLAEKPTTIAGFGITDVFTKTEIGDISTNFVQDFNDAII